MKIFITILLILILLLSLSLGLDVNAKEMQDEAFDRAMIAFGLAKGLNAVISLIQGTEFSFTPVGVGLNFSIGEVLDPFNDMVERFSWVMLGASVSLGIQKLLLLLSSKIFLQIAISLSILTSIFFIWQKRVVNHSYFIFSLRVFILLLVLRFGAIFFVYSSELFYNSVLQDEYQKSSFVLENTQNKLEEIQNESKNIVNSKKKSSWYELDVSAKYKELKEQLNISQKLDDLKASIEEASKNIISLITIFVVQSLIMPLLFLWFFIFSIKFAFRMDLDESKVSLFLNK